jgi:hypothetical protein
MEADMHSSYMSFKNMKKTYRMLQYIFCSQSIPTRGQRTKPRFGYSAKRSIYLYVHSQKISEINIHKSWTGLYESINTERKKDSLY